MPTDGDTPNERADLPDLVPLSTTQLALLKVFSDKSPTLAKMYVGAIIARGSEDNPDYLSQACHSMRELIDNLPKYLPVPYEHSGELRPKVDALADQWKKELRSRNVDTGSLSNKFIGKLTEFFQWVEEHFPTRRDMARNIIRDLDVGGRPLPKALEDLHAAKWMKLRTFFVAGTHHGTCTPATFDECLDEFEAFVSSKDSPSTFETAALLDDLIGEGESDG